MCVCVCVCVFVYVCVFKHILQQPIFFIAHFSFSDYSTMNSATSSVHGKEFHVSLPNYSLYSDLDAGVNHTFPPVSSNRLVQFLASCEKKFDSKIEDLYKKRYGISVYTCT